MAREHRRAAVELAPASVRALFTIREFARLATAAADARLLDAATDAGPATADRFAAMLAVLSNGRGVLTPSHSASDDDVVDPYRRSSATYARSMHELEPGIAQVERVVRLAVAAPPANSKMS